MTKLAKKEVPQILDEVYLRLFSRYPTDEERGIGAKYLQREGIETRESLEDLVWSLVNSPEFVFNH
jgi:hypothetical protein